MLPVYRHIACIWACCLHIGMLPVYRHVAHMKAYWLYIGMLPAWRHIACIWAYCLYIGMWFPCYMVFMWMDHTHVTLVKQNRAVRKGHVYTWLCVYFDLTSLSTLFQSYCDAAPECYIASTFTYNPSRSQCFQLTKGKPTIFPWFNLEMLCTWQGNTKYHFLSFWYDTARNWTHDNCTQ